MPDVKLTIAHEADVSGSQVSETAIQKQIAAATGLSKSYKDAAASAQFLAAAEQGRHAQAAQVNAQLTTEQDKVSKSAADSAAAMQGLWGKTDKTSASKRDLSNALKKLQHDIPGLGLVISALKNVYVAIGAGIALFIREILKQIAAQNEAARASADLAAGMSATIGPLQNQRTAAADAAIANADWAEAMNSAATAAEKVSKGVEAVNKALERRKKMQEEQIELEKQLAIAKVRQAFVLEPERAADAIKAIEAQFSGKRADLDDHALQEKFAALGRALDQAKANQNAAEKSRPQAMAEEQAAKDALENFQRLNKTPEGIGAAANRNRAYKEAVKEEADASLKITELQQEKNSKSFLGLKFPRFGGHPVGKQMEEMLAEQEARRAAALQAQSHYMVQEDAAKANEKLLADDADRARKRREAIEKSAADSRNQAQDFTRQRSGISLELEHQRRLRGIKEPAQREIDGVDSTTDYTRELMEKAKQQQKEMKERAEKGFGAVLDSIDAQGEAVATQLAEMRDLLDAHTAAINGLQGREFRDIQLG